MPLTQCTDLSPFADVELQPLLTQDGAESHHRDNFDDLDNVDDYHRFGGAASINAFGPEPGFIYLLPRNTQIQVSLSWDDFPNSGNDFNLHLTKYNTGPGTWSIIASSVDVQDGNDPPTEWISWTTIGAADQSDDVTEIATS